MSNNYDDFLDTFEI